MLDRLNYSGSTAYTYDDNGIQGETREYIEGMEYGNGFIELIHHGEGRIVRSSSDYLHEYYLRDHLGNNRWDFAGGINVTVPNFSTDYYPFGMQ